MCSHFFNKAWFIILHLYSVHLAKQLLSWQVLMVQYILRICML
jgi:hypothetical protein